MALYFTKAMLYREVASLRRQYGLDPSDLPFDVEGWCGGFCNVDIVKADLRTKGLYGICMFGERTHTIVLNSRRGETERRFDLAHELMHIRFHQDERRRVFECFEKARASQNAFYEYHANEGAAELLLPYGAVVPDLAQLLWEALNGGGSCGKIPALIAEKYRVTPAVARIRIDGLMYETMQYMNGTPLCEIEILSKKAQFGRGIRIKSLGELEKGINSRVKAFYNFGKYS